MAESINQQKAQSESVALFVSDLHLQPSHPATTAAFLDFLARHASVAKQLYLLGDVFETWVGDDDVDDPFMVKIIERLRQVSDAGVAVYWIAGNRDFLVGQVFAAAAGVTLLPDPFVVTIAHHQIVLTHGDAQCTDDLAYMSFRDMVRTPAWQAQFLALPLAQRKAMVAGMRDQSRKAQQSKSYEIMDVNADATQKMFDDTHTSLMIHGHTHRPARHVYAVEEASQRIRYVLPDWECDLAPTRGGWIALGEEGVISRFDLDAVLIPW